VLGQYVTYYRVSLSTYEEPNYTQLLIKDVIYKDLTAPVAKKKMFENKCS